VALNNHIAQTTVDFKGLAELRRSATKDRNDDETLHKVAGQFEALFVNMMLKSMRQASLAEGIFDTPQTETYQEMADQQLAMDLSARGGLGLQDVIFRQLGGMLAGKPVVNETEQGLPIDSVQRRSTLPASDNLALLQKVIQSVPVNKNQTEVPVQGQRITFDSPESFVSQLWPMAKQAAERIGVNPEVIISQAALETGWGKHVLNKANGETSFNLFNIKADKRWDGESTVVGTVEYRNGVAIKEQAQFRSYESYQDSFNDYIDFLQTQPRYQRALQQTDNPELFIEELHKAGYATDPAYADKVKRIMHGSTLAQVPQQLKYS
jgi:peptidoglycan hydrolase FlgJ